MANSLQTRHELQVKLGVLDKLAAEVFALLVFYCDNLIQFKPMRASRRKPVDSGVTGFFVIASKLFMELQMVLSHRVVGLGKQNILQKDSEAAFKTLTLTEILLNPPFHHQKLLQRSLKGASSASFAETNSVKCNFSLYSFFFSFFFSFLFLFLCCFCRMSNAFAVTGLEAGENGVKKSREEAREKWFKSNLPDMIQDAEERAERYRQLLVPSPFLPSSFPFFLNLSFPP